MNLDFLERFNLVVTRGETPRQARGYSLYFTMTCKNCKNHLKLKFSFSRESNDRIKTFTYQWWKCPKCKHVYFGELTEYISDGSYEHALYKADHTIWKNDIKMLKIDPENVVFLGHYSDRIDYSYVK